MIKGFFDCKDTQYGYAGRDDKVIEAIVVLTLLTQLAKKIEQTQETFVQTS